jgi:hypothetical protein
MRLVVVSGLCLCLTGCVGNVAYRMNTPMNVRSVLHEEVQADHPLYTLCFIEFDDMGEMFQRDQLDCALGEIRRAKEREKEETGYNFVEVVVFIHGWKNNASDKSGNVTGFRESLKQIANTFNRPHPPVRKYPVPLIGIYIGWRGAVTSIPVVKEFTFWDRQRAANRVPHPSLTEALHRIMIATKGTDFNDASVCILIGHSFGGLVLERALSQSLESMLLRKSQPAGADLMYEKSTCELRCRLRSERQPALPFDLVVFLNEAGPATEGRQLLDFLKANDIHVVRNGGNTQNPGFTEHPLIVSMTSEGDVATKVLFPFGQFFSRPFYHLRSYPADDVWAQKSKKQSTLYRNTTANMKELQSHKIVPRGACDSRATEPSRVAVDSCTYTTMCLKEGRFDVVRIENVPNTTPYWVMQIPRIFVRDHTQIFDSNLASLLFEIMRPTMTSQIQKAKSESTK